MHQRRDKWYDHVSRLEKKTCNKSRNVYEGEQYDKWGKDEKAVWISAPGKEQAAMPKKKKMQTKKKKKKKYFKTWSRANVSK